MINFVLTFNIWVAILTIIASLILYWLRFVKPELSRDEDLIFVTFGLIYSLIIALHGWRLDPILLFSQTILVITVISAGWENIRLRGLLVEIAKRAKKRPRKPRKKSKSRHKMATFKLKKVGENKYYLILS